MNSFRDLYFPFFAFKKACRCRSEPRRTRKEPKTSSPVRSPLRCRPVNTHPPLHEKTLPIPEHSIQGNVSMHGSLESPHKTHERPRQISLPRYILDIPYITPNPPSLVPRFIDAFRCCLFSCLLLVGQIIDSLSGIGKCPASTVHRQALKKFDIL